MTGLDPHPRTAASSDHWVPRSVTWSGALSAGCNPIRNTPYSIVRPLRQRAKPPS